MVRSPRVASAVVCLALGVGACHAPPPEASTGAPLRGPAPPVTPAAAGSAMERLATVPSGTFGPYVGDRPEGTVAVWASELGGKRRWMSVGIKDGVRPWAEPKEIAQAAADLELVTVRPIGGGVNGFVVVASAREPSGDKVETFPLGLRGEPAGKPTAIAQSLPDVVWIDAVQTQEGALAMWAVRRDDRADIYGVELAGNGEPRTQPALFVESVRAWQVLSNQGGAAIATVTAGRGRGAKGPLTLNFIDAHARIERRPLIVSDGNTVDSDVDIARISDHLVMAWTDSTELESRVYAALLDPRGSLLKPPAPLGQPFGPQEVLRIVPPVQRKGPAFLVWENLVERPPTGRAVRVARLSSDGLLDPASALVTISAGDGALPDFAATPSGVAALTLAPACQTGRGCVGDRPVSTFVQLTEGMDLVATQPLQFASMNGAFAELAWGLTCRTGECTALAVAPFNPAPVLAMKLGSAGGGWQAPARKVSASAPPRVASIAALGRSTAVADVAASSAGQAAAAAWITDFDPATPFTRSKTPAPDGKLEPPRAVVSFQGVPVEGPTPEPSVVSYRGHSPGGVAMAPGDPTRGETLVAWAGIDNKSPEVFLTLMGSGNRKVAQKMLTHAHAGISDITVVDTSDGWVVGWIQERGGGSEAHVAKVDRNLRPIVADRQLGVGASVASGIQLLVMPREILVVWSDARGRAPGAGDVYVRRLNAKDLVPLAPERTLTETAAHSRSPVARRLGDGAIVLWVEEPTPGADRGVTAMLAELDAQGNTVQGSVSAIALNGAPRGLDAACGDDGCRIVATVAAPDGGALDAFEWRRGRVEPRRLVALAALPREARPAVLGDDVFYADEVHPSDGRIRKLRVEWQ